MKSCIDCGAPATKNIGDIIFYCDPCGDAEEIRRQISMEQGAAEAAEKKRRTLMTCKGCGFQGFMNDIPDNGMGRQYCPGPTGKNTEDCGRYNWDYELQDERE